MTSQLQWRPIEGVPIDLDFVPGDLGKIVFKIPTNAGFGVLEWAGQQVTYYFDPAEYDEDFQWVIRPYIVNREGGE
jgi:hypothetical protein